MTKERSRQRRNSTLPFRNATGLLRKTITTIALLVATMGMVHARLKGRQNRRLSSSLSLEERLRDMHGARTRIVGGKPVSTKDAYPFFVNLGACAGALVHGDIVLTAAHVSHSFTRTDRQVHRSAAFKIPCAAASAFLTTHSFVSEFYGSFRHPNFDNSGK